VRTATKLNNAAQIKQQTKIAHHVLAK